MLILRQIFLFNLLRMMYNTIKYIKYYKRGVHIGQR